MLYGEMLFLFIKKKTPTGLALGFLLEQIFEHIFLTEVETNSLCYISCNILKFIIILHYASIGTHLINLNVNQVKYQSF